MKWVEVSVESPPEYVEPLTEVFHRYGHGGVALEELGGFNPDEGESPPSGQRVTIRTYIPSDSTLEDRRNRIDLAVRLISHLSPVSPLRSRVIEESDWETSWKKHFHPLHIGNRMVVAPTWGDYPPGDSELVVQLDPGMAFGTGHHPTTRMCLEMLEEMVSPSAGVLDVGCGSGILSIAACMLGATSVLALDVDPTSVSVASSNVTVNGAKAIVRVGQGTLPRPEVTPGSYDVVVANISAKVVSELAQELVAAAVRGGVIIASGVLEDKRDEVSRRLASFGADTESVRVDGDWVALVARKS